MSTAQPSENDEYLLAGQDSELERLRLQSRVLEPSGRRLLEEIGDGAGAAPLTSAAAFTGGSGC